MKHLFIFIALIILLSACGSQAADVSGAEAEIITTVFPLYDFTRAVAGSRASVTLLLPPSADSHSYEPTPRDIIRIRDADVFLYIGGASDGWVERVLSGGENAVKLMDSVKPHPGDNCAHGFFDEYDEHIWTSPVNAILMTRAILAALCAADPVNADYYKANAESYIGRLGVLDSVLRDITASPARSTLVFGDRFAFRYLTEEYGLEYLAAFPGCAEQSEPSAMTLAYLIEKIKNENIPVIFYGELSDMRTAASVSRETGAEIMLLHSVHTVTEEQLNAGVGYIELMMSNAEALRKALN
jgi:zinc transport system substrate-binding protein